MQRTDFEICTIISEIYTILYKICGNVSKIGWDVSEYHNKHVGKKRIHDRKIRKQIETFDYVSAPFKSMFYFFCLYCAIFRRLARKLRATVAIKIKYFCRMQACCLKLLCNKKNEVDNKTSWNLKYFVLEQHFVK